MTHRWTDIERLVFLVLALAFITAQAIAMIGMGILWVVAGHWALTGLFVVLPGCVPVVWLIRQATSKVDEQPARVSISRDVLPHLHNLKPQRRPNPTELAEARLRHAAATGGEINLNELPSDMVEELLGKRKKALG